MCLKITQFTMAINVTNALFIVTVAQDKRGRKN